MHYPTVNTAHTIAFGTPVMEYWMEREIAQWVHHEGRKEGNVLFNDTLNTFYLRLYGVRHMVKDHSDSEKGNPLPPHRLLFPARFLLYAPSHRQDSTYHGLCYTSRGALAGTRNSSTPRRIDPMTHRTMSERSYHGATSRSSHHEQMIYHGTTSRYLKPNKLLSRCPRQIDQIMELTYFASFVQSCCKIFQQMVRLKAYYLLAQICRTLIV